MFAVQGAKPSAIFTESCTSVILTTPSWFRSQGLMADRADLNEAVLLEYVPLELCAHRAEYKPAAGVMRCAHPFPFNAESAMNGLPDTTPVMLPVTEARETITSLAEDAVRGAPWGELEAAWLLSTAVPSRETAAPGPVNSQITAVPFVTFEPVAMATAVVPAIAFTEYQISATDPAAVSIDLAAPAST
jgi:hypothetical protein